MANPVQALNENFVYNSMLARALVQLLPSNDRLSFRYWLDKLLKMDETPEQMTTRNDYMWFMLLVLQANKRITEPFKSMPPEGDLPPLRNILPQRVYEDILTSTDKNMAWLDKAGQGDEMESKPQDSFSSPPSQFLYSQPLPKEGIICYMAAFSDHDY